MHVYRVTKYDPADRDESGFYVGTEDTDSDHGRVEAAYLSAVEAFAEHTGVTELTIRDPEVSGFANFGLEPRLPGHGLAELFPPDLTGYHDGARVPVSTGLALVRAMLRDNGAWCRLEDEERFFVHIGYDQYMYVGSAEPCDEAVAHTRALGLFPELIDWSPYDPSYNDGDEYLPADDAFWAELTELARDRESVILEEIYVANASRWHRVRAADIVAIRSGLGPRALLQVWPELNEDVLAELRTLEDRGSSRVVWEDRDGRITGFWADDENYPAIAAGLAKAVAALVIPAAVDDQEPLLTAVLPDEDGVVRSRWRA